MDKERTKSGVRNMVQSNIIFDGHKHNEISKYKVINEIRYFLRSKIEIIMIDELREKLRT